MVEPTASGGITVARIDTCPSPAVVALFRQSFPRHPVSRLDTSLTGSFLGVYARNTTLLVARDDATGEDFGFLIGGGTSMLDATRNAFIRTHATRIALASARNRTLMRLVVARLRPSRTYADAPYAAHQLRFIAVAERARGLGVGTRLVAAFEALIAAQPGYHTWTMAGELGAEAFFCRRGFTRDFAVDQHVRLYKALA